MIKIITIIIIVIINEIMIIFINAMKTLITVEFSMLSVATQATLT